MFDPQRIAEWSLPMPQKVSGWASRRSHPNGGERPHKMGRRKIEFMGVLSRENFQRITSLMQTPTLQSLPTPQAFVQAGRSEAPHRIASSDPPTLSPTPFTCPLKPTLQPTNRESRIQNP